MSACCECEGGVEGWAGSGLAHSIVSTQVSESMIWILNYEKQRDLRV